NPAREVAPEAVGGLKHLGFVGRLRVFRRERLGLAGVGHGAHDREDEFIRRARANRNVGAAATLAVGVKQFVASYGFDAPGRARDKKIEGLWILLAPAILWIGAEREPFPLWIDLDAALRPEFPLAEDQMAEDEKAAFRPFDGDAPLHRRLGTADG